MGGNPRCPRVFVGEGTLRRHLEQAGPVETVDLPSRQGALAGFGFVRYATAAATEHALGWGGTAYGGNRVGMCVLGLPAEFRGSLHPGGGSGF